MDCILKTKDLSKVYKSGKANNNISANIKKGSIYGLLGPNRAGKTFERKDIEHIGSIIFSVAFLYTDIYVKKGITIYYCRSVLMD